MTIEAAEAPEVGRYPADLPEEDKLLYGMFTQDSGRVLIDSGGESGRLWQRNRHRDLRKRPYGGFEISAARRKIEYPWLSTYHFLRENVKHHPKLDSIWQRWSNREENQSESLHELMERFPQWIGERCPAFKWGHPYDSSRQEAYYAYTYNADNVMDTDFHFSCWVSDRTEYYLVSLHTGMDARWGFSDAHVFVGTGDTRLMDTNQMFICCSGDARHMWNYDGGWTYDGAGGGPTYRDTTPYERSTFRNLTEIPIKFTTKHPDYDPKRDKFKKGSDVVLVVNARNQIHCPVTGCKGILGP
jgi:hypothetical protein